VKRARASGGPGNNQDNSEGTMRAVATESPNLQANSLRLLWGLAATVATLALTGGFALLAVVLVLLTRKPWPPDVFGPVWSRWILKLSGAHIEVDGLDGLDTRRSYVIISNHLSYFDIWAILAAVPLKIHFVAKKELLRLPVFGSALALSNHIVIDRSNPQEAIARINSRAAAQIDQGFCIVFFAEGTRSWDGKVQAFKKGGVTLALLTHLPVIPVSISGTRKFLPKGCVRIRPGGRIRVVLGAPIDVTGLAVEQRDELNDRVRSLVIKNYLEDC
jgi:1-acyl-sn-glycerol-3-phosphate acyltransferase